MFVCQNTDAAFIPLNFMTPHQTNFLEVSIRIFVKDMYVCMYTYI